MVNNYEIVYEFSSVYDRNGKDKMNKDHANPVFIYSLIQGRSAILMYADKPELCMKTSTVESVFIFENKINIITKNTEYWLRPRLREVIE